MRKLIERLEEATGARWGKDAKATVEDFLNKLSDTNKLRGTLVSRKASMGAVYMENENDRSDKVVVVPENSLMLLINGRSSWAQNAVAYWSGDKVVLPRFDKDELTYKGKDKYVFYDLNDVGLYQVKLKKVAQEKGIRVEEKIIHWK